MNSVKQKISNYLTVEKLDSDSSEEPIFTWSEVNQIHRSRNGIFQVNGILKSLLTDLGKLSRCYPDVESDDGDTLIYTGSGRRGDQKPDIYNRALREAIHRRLEVPLFCKLKVNCWRFMGLWRVIDSEYVYEKTNKRMVWRFVLRAVKGEREA